MRATRYDTGQSETDGRLGYTVRMRLRPPDPGYVELLTRYDAKVQKLALAARKLILEEAPQASEFIY